jgi:murein DD-endopeptidase MepM/ murein hydrolase activator NlpD
MNFGTFIQQNKNNFAPLFIPALTRDNTINMDLSSSGDVYEGLGEFEMDAAILRKLRDAGALAGVGGYLENRSVYEETELSDGDAGFCIHIGVDVFMPDGVSVYAPLDGEVHSFANRKVEGGYGPVIILRHRLNDFVFHTLYGHLSEASLNGLADDKVIARGEKIAEIGPRLFNGNWPPHLHFQLIQDMQEYRGDYPGVVRPEELDFFKTNCPDPLPLLVLTS